MKKPLLIAAVLACTLKLNAQKATAENQIQIIQTQHELMLKLDSIQKMQKELNSLQWSSMNMENDITKISYAYGISLAENLLDQGFVEIDYSAFTKGIKDVFTGAPTDMTIQQAQQLLNEYLSNMMQKKAQDAKNRGEAFLAENAKKNGVNVTASGLQYEVINEGQGPKPTATTQVTVHYHGTTIDGKIFDSSVERGQPATFGLNQVITGWTEGLQLMSKGAKYRFFIPSELAYGSRGAGNAIGPNEVLIFEVELINF